MKEKSTNMEVKNDLYRRNHERWRAEHAEEFAILNSAKAQILAHEAQILAHEVQFDRHLHPTESNREEFSASDRSDTGLTEAHEVAAPHHHDLLRAIRALKPYLNGGPQA